MPTARPRPERVPGDPQEPLIGELDANPGSIITLIDETVPGGEEWYIRIAFGTARFPGEFRILVDNVSKGFGNTTELDDNIDFSWDPFFRLVAGEVLKMNFDALSGFPVEKVRAQIQYNKL